MKMKMKMKNYPCPESSFDLVWRAIGCNAKNIISQWSGERPFIPVASAITIQSEWRRKWVLESWGKLTRGGGKIERIGGWELGWKSNYCIVAVWSCKFHFLLRLRATTVDSGYHYFLHALQLKIFLSQLQFMELWPQATDIFVDRKLWHG